MVEDILLVLASADRMHTALAASRFSLKFQTQIYLVINARGEHFMLICSDSIRVFLTRKQVVGIWLKRPKIQAFSKLASLINKRR